METDQPGEKPRGDQMTTDFFRNVLETYLEEDRIESGVLRLELADGQTRRIVVEDDTASLDPYEYVLRELEETIHLIEENEDLLDDPIELSVPVGDTERVIEEVTEEETVTTLFRTSGITTILEHLHDVVGDEQRAALDETPDEG